MLSIWAEVYSSAHLEAQSDVKLACKSPLHNIRKDRYSPMKAYLILEDGTVFTGTSIGSQREVISEIVLTHL